MRIVKSLLVIGLLASSLVYAGPAFEKAIRKGGVTDTEKNYVGRVKMLALWLFGQLERLKTIEQMQNSKDINAAFAMSNELIRFGSLIEDSIKQQGYTWAIDAISEIRHEAKRVWDPNKEQENRKQDFDFFKNYYVKLYQAVNEWVGGNADRRALVGNEFVYADPALIRNI